MPGAWLRVLPEVARYPGGTVCDAAPPAPRSPRHGR